ncbi:hypothetical protein BL254_14050 [Protofrankia sp. BMG5.30]|nr:hypothetical protein BL254_14050 [Protofrankia sp. BMG5.30]
MYHDGVAGGLEFGGDGPVCLGLGCTGFRAAAVEAAVEAAPGRPLAGADGIAGEDDGQVGPVGLLG